MRLSVKRRRHQRFSRLSLAAMGLEYTSHVFSLPLIVGGTIKPSCEAGEEFDALIWYVQWLEVGVDQVFYARERRITRVCGDLGAIAATLRGAAHGALLITAAARRLGGGDAKEMVEGVMTFLPELSKFGRLSTIAAATDDVSVFPLLLIDVICGAGVCWLHLNRSFPAIEEQSGLVT